MHVVDIAPCANRSRTCSLVGLNHASQPLMTVILASTYSATESIVFLLIHSMSYCLVKFFCGRFRHPLYYAAIPPIRRILTEAVIIACPFPMQKSLHVGKALLARKEVTLLFAIIPPCRRGFYLPRREGIPKGMLHLLYHYDNPSTQEGNLMLSILHTSL